MFFNSLLHHQNGELLPVLHKTWRRATRVFQIQANPTTGTSIIHSRAQAITGSKLVLRRTRRRSPRLTSLPRVPLQRSWSQNGNLLMTSNTTHAGPSKAAPISSRVATPVFPSQEVCPFFVPFGSCSFLQLHFCVELRSLSHSRWEGKGESYFTGSERLVSFFKSQDPIPQVKCGGLSLSLSTFIVSRHLCL